jgi:hypothetical protein
MSGSVEVNARLGAVIKAMEKGCEKAMDAHIARSESFAKSEHPWQSRTGAASGSIQHKTDTDSNEIVSTVYAEDVVMWLDQAWFFNGRYKIIEKARSHNLLALWTALRAVMKGSGFIRGG